MHAAEVGGRPKEPAFCPGILQNLLTFGSSFAEIPCLPDPFPQGTVTRAQRVFQGQPLRWVPFSAIHPWHDLGRVTILFEPQFAYLFSGVVVQIALCPAQREV